MLEEVANSGETGGRRAEGRIDALKGCQRLQHFILELCDLV